jgi:hypothetical protein
MLVGLITERNKLSEMDAIQLFYRSKLARKINDKNVMLRQMSPYFLYELWQAEYSLGDYTKSPYITALL